VVAALIANHLRDALVTAFGSDLWKVVACLRLRDVMNVRPRLWLGDRCLAGKLVFGTLIAV
jgi:hypothetical protein